MYFDIKGLFFFIYWEDDWFYFVIDNIWLDNVIYGLSCIEEGKLVLGGGVKYLFFFLFKEVSFCGGMFYREK